jgi:hypothetical protein
VNSLLAKVSQEILLINRTGGHMILFSILFGFLAKAQDSNMILIKKNEFAFYQTKFEAVQKALKDADAEARQKCPSDNVYNPSLMNLKTQIQSPATNTSVGAVSVEALYLCNK